MTIPETIANLHTWRLLFETEGTYVGDVRKVYEESYQRLLQGVCKYPSTSVCKVRPLLTARLCMQQLDKEELEGMAHNLLLGKRIKKDNNVHACFVRVCQDLRLSCEEIEGLRGEVFDQ